MLRAIQAFEATARNGSYVDAAAELQVTSAAVGQQVRALEAWLGVPLFRRLSTGSARLVPTEAARLALPEFKEAFDRLDAGLRRLRRQHGRATVNVSVSQSFASRWLLPRMEAFTVAHPHIDVQINITDRLVDIAHGEADLGIRCGLGPWPDLQHDRLMDEQMVPVCSPALLSAEGPPHRLADLVRLPLIHDTSMRETEAFPSWESWLARWDPAIKAPAGGLRIDSSAGAIQAALSGQGAALVRRRFVESEFATGHLIHLFVDYRWPIEWAYFLVYTDTTRQDPAIAAFAAWLRESTQHAVAAPSRIKLAMA